MTQYTELLAQVHTLIPLCPNNDQIILLNLYITYLDTNFILSIEKKTGSFSEGLIFFQRLNKL